MLTLVTGSPGAGKTLWTVKHIVEELVPTGRPIFTNINGLNIDAPNVHQCDDDMPYKWFEQEDGSIFVFDEVQRQYPPRHATSKVPKHISEYQTHRHKGMDIFLVTQGPKLIDRHLHDLTERHVHLFRAFGMSRSKIYDWGSVNDTPQPPQSWSSAMKSTFNFPKKYYDYYKSATIHTVQPRLPWKWFLLIGVLGLFVIGAGLKVLFWVKDIVPDTDLSSNEDPTHRSEGLNHIAQLCSFDVIGRTRSHVIARKGDTIVNLQVSERNGNEFFLDYGDGVCQVYIQ